MVTINFKLLGLLKVVVDLRVMVDLISGVVMLGLGVVIAMVVLKKIEVFFTVVGAIVVRVVNLLLGVVTKYLHLPIAINSQPLGLTITLCGITSIKLFAFFVVEVLCF